MKKFLFVLCLMLVSTGFLAARQANALLIGVSGGQSTLGAYPEIILAPLTVFDDATVNLGMQGFNERQGVTLLSGLAIDGGTIAAGTIVNSHMIFLDEGGNEFPQVSNVHPNIVWTFDGPILGVMSDFYGNMEAASNSALGAAGTLYPGAFNGRGFEPDPGFLPPDSYSISGNRLTISMSVTEPGDWIRVVTRVPEPSTFLLLGSGLIGLGYARRMSKA